MLLSLNWLRDYLQKPDLKIDPKDLAEKLTMRGLTVASIKKPAAILEYVVVGKIVKIEKHPNAEKLQITQVITEEKSNGELRQIVCGAKNIAEGDIVPVALPGAVLPGEFQIKISTIRGVESKGMLCSAKELGVSDDAEGILQLPKHAHLGELVSRLLGGHQSDDAIFEFEITPNRGDCLSAVGIAREAASILGTRIREPKLARFKNTPHRTSSIIKVEIDDFHLCPRYVARVIDSIKVTESPDWIKQRLLSVGLRPVNNIVDITNFVMLEMGLPLHAFDLRKLKSGTIRVGTCKTPREFMLLNGQQITIEPTDIVIFDGEEPIALAGIMGGMNSRVEEDSSSFILESAVFNPIAIRRTAKRLGLLSDAAKRFEKGVDVQMTVLASERAASLLRDSFNANVYHPPIDTNENAWKETLISIDMREVRKITGISELNSEIVAELLESIGIGSHKKSLNILSVKVPSFRTDLKTSIDAIEEIARLVGYDQIPRTYPFSSASYDRFDESNYEYERSARQFLANLGLRETIHYSFTSEENLSKYGLLQEGIVSIQNPISDEMKVLRTSLLPSLFETYLYNRNRKQTNQHFFEVGKVYTGNPEEETKVTEQLFIAGILSGNATPQGWKAREEAVNYYHGKGIVEALIKYLVSVRVMYEQPKFSRLFHPNRSALIKLGLKEIGYVGEIHPYVRSEILATQETLVAFELNLDSLRRYERMGIKYSPPSKFPTVELDLAVLVDRVHSSHSLTESIRQIGGSLLSQISIFDVYEGEQIPTDKKSIAFRLVFSSSERTLQDQEVLALRDRIVQTLAERFSVQLRA